MDNLGLCDKRNWFQGAKSTTIDLYIDRSVVKIFNRFVNEKLRRRLTLNKRLVTAGDPICREGNSEQGLADSSPKEAAWCGAWWIRVYFAFESSYLCICTLPVLRIFVA